MTFRSTLDSALMATAKEPDGRPTLVQGLSAWDGALITMGSILGTGIFLTTSDIARVLPHPGLILFVWIIGGLLTLAGALTYAELGAMFPKAGGQYHYLREAYGPLWGFLFGWTCFLVIMSGGIATMAVGFGEYLGSFVPFFATQNVLLHVPLGSWTFELNGGQVAGALAIALLSAVNYYGLREGTFFQNAVTLVKVGALAALVVFGLFVTAPVKPDYFAPVATSAGVLTAVGVGMISVLWTFDGWYGVTALAGEMRRPERDLPRSIFLGTLGVTLLYVLVNLVYARALPVDAMAGSQRIGEAAASSLFGGGSARLVSLAVLISTFGCISSTILYCTRIYLAMAQDGLFFRKLSEIHPRHRTPGASIVAQGIWATILTFSGSYAALYTYVVFASCLFLTGTGIAVFVLRKNQPETPRPYRTWGYPLVPAVFVLSSAILGINTLLEKPTESWIGLGLVAAGIPAYHFWRARAARPVSPVPAPAAD